MAIKTENLYRKLYDNLRSKGYETTPINATTGKDTVPEDADFLQFDFDKEEDVSPVTLVVEKFNDRYALIAYYNDDSAYTDSEEWSNLIPKIRSIAQRCGIHGFVLKNSNDFKPDMAKRQYMKKQEQITEGYHAMGKQSSYNDAIPNVKIILQHNKKIEEGEQRFRHIAKIFVENANGERFLIPTNKPGLARVYARHIAEGGTPYDDRANHISSLVEEYEKMGGFVRAIRNKQFNESTQKLVLEGVGHYQKLRETLSRMTGHRGYNVYFESWTPPLMEDDTDATSITELFVQETVDPRIESAMPILAKLSKNISEMAEISELAEWADSLLEGGDGGEASEEPVEQIEEAPGAETLSHNQSTEKQNLKAFGLAEDDLQEPAIDELDEEESLTSNNPVGIPEGRLDGEADIDSPVADAITRRILMRHTDLLAKHGPEKVADAIATIADSLDGFIGPDDEIGTSDVSGWVKRVEQELSGSQLEESHMSEADMIIQDVISGELDAYDIMNHPKTPEEEYVANILQHQYEEVSRDHRLHPDDDFEQILDIVVDNLAKDYGHPEDPNQIEEEKPGLWANIHAKRERIKHGSGEKMRKPGSKGAPTAQNFRDAAKEDVEMEEGLGDVAKKVGSALKTGAKAVGKAIVGPDDEELLQNLKKAAGVRNPQTGKPSMAHSDVEKVDEDGQFAGDFKTGPEGQWRNKGPKANKPAKVGDLVGASESVEAGEALTEMDKSEDKKGPEGKAKAVKAKDFAKDAEKKLEKHMDKAHKKDVKEGQEDLNAIMRLLGK